MKYYDAKEIALDCRNFEDVDNLLKEIECDLEITDRQFYNLKTLALNAACDSMENNY